MATPTDQKSTTRPAVGLTGKGRAAVVLIRVRESWDSLSDDQQQECADLVARLAIALKAERNGVNHPNPRSLPLAARLSA
jgi:hypothetical protein